MTKNDPRKALGKGLHSLLPNRSATIPPSATAPTAQQKIEPVSPPVGSVSQVPVEQVFPNPNQPRRSFDAAAMFELTLSIERDGVIQPIVVRPSPGGRYEIIAGERRWRAAKRAGLTEIPIVLRDADDEKVLELAIVENVQREDLNPIELAIAFQRMAAELNLSHDQIGEKTGKDRATISNSIRLLQLPQEVQDMVATKRLSPGHARALLKVQNEQRQREMAERSLNEGWSVRQMEEFTKPSKVPTVSGEKTLTEPPRVDPNVKAAISELERVLGTRVRVAEKGKNKGQIEIEYYSDEDLDRIYNQIVGE